METNNYKELKEKQRSKNCDKFRGDTSINPITDKHITKYKSIYNILDGVC